MSQDPLLAARDLCVSLAAPDALVRPVEGVSLAVARGEVVAIVGESGSGKSLTALALMGLRRSPRWRLEGSVRLGGSELIGAPERELRRVRGSEIALVFQEPRRALNPVGRIGAQIAEQIRVHERVSKQAAAQRAAALLERVGLPAARAAAFPHELSGGMCQRATIAMALSCGPSVLIADEPTAALDPTVQAQVLDLLGELSAAEGMAVVLVSHDLGVVAELADRVAVMYAGRVVEEGPADAIFHDPQHPYTWALLGSITRPDRPPPARLPTLAGATPAAGDATDGCRLRGRCPHALAACREEPALRPRGGRRASHLDRCWLGEEEKRSLRGVGDGIGLEGSGTGA